ncbi:hypothetical protein [Cellulomonas sp. URHE0023]|uniref:Eco57I restriction-modification methylase domain-containing protein n=1 Tax=Cellulomonas sp. URHE0023 TaxID=1380354 RepID=UPI0018CBF59F|nr:hypothetical protein [Cellulomonas sp. URHE0023]
MGEAGRAILAQRDADLIKALGFRTTRHTANALLLVSDGHSPRAVAVLIDATEQFDQRTARLSGSPVTYGLAIALQQEIPWVVVIRKDQIRLYPGLDGVGVGAKGQTETYFEIDLATIDADHAALLPLVFSAAALAAGGSTDQILADSARYATELGKRLRQRVYGEVVPSVAVEVAHQLAKQGRALDADGLATAYQVTLRILFRLLFQAYAEDRGLLPAGRNEGFDANSLKSQGRRLLDAGALEFGDAAILWRDLEQVWLAIDKGQPLWQVPAYNGGLFSSDADRSSDGALIASIELPDRVLAPALRALLVDRTDDGTEGLVDFRSLSVREFGTIYEGLLESSLSRADQDLTEDSEGAWVPAEDGDEALVGAGGVYFHSASGERKATGSYFTPKVVVDHLIERSVVPALSKHLDRIAAHLSAGDASAAARDFFDFRVADLAMGSGHFLVAAIDKIEALMRTFLTQHTVPGVTEEMRRLSEVAKEALGTDDVAKLDVDEVGLLRRQIARRCIYGLDINLMAVELARLALWIHTFVPGLPMSNLDHGLVCADSLTGIGTIDEAVNALAKVAETTLTAFEPVEATSDDDDELLTLTQDVLFGSVQQRPALAPKRPMAKAKPSVGYKAAIRALLREHLDRVTPLLLDVANASEATKAEVEAAATRLAAAREASAPIARLFDAAVAVRLGEWTTNITNESTLRRLTEATEPSRIVAPLRPAHLPMLFPEVFVRENPGFDVLLGNPPWEELVFEELKFWTLAFPGLKSRADGEQKALVAAYRESRPDLVAAMEQERAWAERLRLALARGPYPGFETGNADLYKAFCWRFWTLLRRGGRVGVVLPRGALSALGSAEWRQEILANGSFADVSFIVNSARWAFDMEPRWTIALTVLEKGESQFVRFSGPFASESEFRDGVDKSTEVSVSDFSAWTPSAAFPAMPNSASSQPFLTIRQSPSLGGARSDLSVRPAQGDFNQTTDAALWNVGDSTGDLPVLKGGSFNLWDPDAGPVHGSAAKTTIRTRAEAKLRRQVRTKSSALFGEDAEGLIERGRLPYQRTRIAFRDVARGTDSRTMIACLVPPAVLTNKAPYLIDLHDNAAETAYLLGVLCSIPFDWYARRFVELSLNFYVLNALPVPIYAPSGATNMRVVEIAGRLAAVDERYSAWAAEVGVPVASVTSQTMKDDLIAELDALVALLYGLTEEQLTQVFATFHRGWDYQPRLAAVLAHFRNWGSEA